MFSGIGQINMNSIMGNEIYKLCKNDNIRNIIEVGTWLLVADRDYSTKKTHCDMLEVYSKSEISKLMEMSNDWAVFTGEEPEKKDYDAIVRSEEVTMDIEFDDI